jgi:hypothetical protein
VEIVEIVFPLRLGSPVGTPVPDAIPSSAGAAPSRYVSTDRGHPDPNDRRGVVPAANGICGRIP